MGHPRTAATLTVLAALAVGCSSNGDKTESAAPPSAANATTPAAAGATEPRTDAAVRAAASDEFDSFASGDYGGAWDVFYGPAKKAISRKEYERLAELCPDPAQGARFQVEKVTMDSNPRPVFA